MDLSGIIFVALALGWAVYLLPKALQREEEKALSRSVDSFSDSVRVLGRKPTQPPAGEGAATSAPQGEGRAVPAPAVPAYTVSRAAARKAASRRRRVLGILTLLLLGTVATSAFAVTPWWSTAVPGGLVVVFLVVARFTVRRQQVRRPAVPASQEQPTPKTAQDAAPAAAPTPASVEPALDREDTVGVSREELAAAVAAPTTDAGSLWDPLPVTLPTYVNKARARRTVRTIELTQTGVTSSGHDAADTELARQADAERPAARPAGSAKPDDLDERKVVGG